MRIEDLFIDEKVRENIALRTNLKCFCGCESFSVVHSGKFFKLFGSGTIIKRNSQLAIKCICSSCKKEYVIYDSSIDGTNPKGEILNEFCPVEIKKSSVFNIRLSYNFYAKNFKTDEFENMFIDLKMTDSDKYIRICEI